MIKGYLPIHASCMFSCSKPRNWDEPGKDEQDEYFLNHATRDSSLCHQCCRNVSTDFEVNTDYLEDANEELELWEE